MPIPKENQITNLSIYLLFKLLSTFAVVFLSSIIIKETKIIVQNFLQ